MKAVKLPRTKCEVCDNWQLDAVWKLHGHCIFCLSKPGAKWDPEST